MSSAVQAPILSLDRIEIDALLSPIPGENPAGESLLYAGLYDEIREARREDENLAQGEWRRDRKVANWSEVVKLATEALSRKTKDIQVAAWLTEALVKTRGLYGFIDGLVVIRGLLERYWDQLYPEVDEGDPEARANALLWMDRTLVLPKALKETQLSNSPTGLKYTYLQFEEGRKFDVPEHLDQLDSEDLRRISDLKQQAEDEGKITTEQWRIAEAATPLTFFEERQLLLEQCRQEFNALDRVIDEKFGRYAPGMGEIKRTLEDLRSCVDRIIKEKRKFEPAPIAPVPEVVSAESEPYVEARFTTGAIQTRTEALRRLAEVAHYFRVTEPHSPVSYLVQRAIKWGQMPLESWLEDVIKNDGVLGQLRETLGLDGGTDGSGPISE